MPSPELIEHFRNPRNTGEIPPPAVTVEASNPACGDILRLSVQWEAGRIARIAFRTRGCAASIAAGSVLTTILEGRTREEASAISPRDIENALGGLPAESKHAAVLCLDAVKALLKASG